MCAILQHLEGAPAPSPLLTLGLNSSLLGLNSAVSFGVNPPRNSRNRQAGAPVGFSTGVNLLGNTAALNFGVTPTQNTGRGRNGNQKKGTKRGQTNGTG